MWQPADQVECKFAFNAFSHVGVDPEHPPISPLSLWERALSDMAACAMHRFVAVRDLADTFASLNLKGISDCDLTRVTSAVHLLMREGCAILNVIQARAVQREEAYKTPV
jgi:hypothetical protein